MIYAGIGSRETPLIVLNEMTAISRELARLNFTLRSGGAKGADQAFEKGCDELNGKKEIFLPWDGFEGKKSLFDLPLEAFSIAWKFHPNWNALSAGAKKLMARNSQQICGPDCETSMSDFVICWTANGSDKGGTGQAIRIAWCYDIPVYNLYNHYDRNQLSIFLPQLKYILE